MAYSFTDYTIDFRDKATNQGFKYTFKQIFSLLPSTVGHLLDTLLGLDGLKIMGGDRYNYLQGPFGAILGFPFLGLGWGLGYVIQGIVKSPAFLASKIDLGISKLLEGRFWYFSGPRRFQELMLSGPAWNMVVWFFYTLPTGLPLPDNMHGPFGFLFGLIPEYVHYIVNRLGAVVNAFVRYIVDHCTDVVNYIYNGIFAGLKKCFTSTQSPEASAESSAQLEEEQPILETKPPVKKRIVRKKDREDEVIKEDNTLKKVLDEKMNLLSILEIDPQSYLNDSVDDRKKQVTKAYQKNSRQYHSDKHMNDTEEEKEYAREKWDSLLLAKNILLDPVKAAIYLSRSNLNRNAFFYHGPDESKAGPAATSTATDTKQATGSNDEAAPIQRKKIRRRGA